MQKKREVAESITGQPYLLEELQQHMAKETPHNPFSRKTSMDCQLVVATSRLVLPAAELGLRCVMMTLATRSSIYTPPNLVESRECFVLPSLNA